MAEAARALDLQDPGVRRAWAALHAAAPSASPFGALAYAEAAAEAFGLRARPFGVEQDGALVAALVAYEKRRGPYRLAVVPPLTPITPVLLAEPPAEADVHARRSPLDALIAGLDGHFHALGFRLQPEITDVRPFTWAGYTASPRYTYAQPLGPTEAFLAGASKMVRRRIRREADRFELAEASDQLDVLGRLEAEVYDRQGTVSPLDPTQRDVFLRRLLGADLGRLFVLRETATGEAVGARVVVTDGTAAFFTIAASRPGPAMTVMTHLVRERLVEAGVQSLDLVGANLPTVAEFKRSFGMPLVMQFYVTRIARPELRALALLRPVV